jgi:O-antigen ligase
MRVAVQIKRITLDQSARFLWALVLLTLPVTSFRYFPGLGESTYVRPLSLYPLTLLMPLLLICLLRKRISRPWPGILIPLGAFALVALLATATGGLLAPLELRGQAYWERAVRAWVTLAIGLAFFLSAMWMNQNRDDLRFSIKWLLAGLTLDLAWSGVQLLAFYTPAFDKRMVTLWQRAFSMRELVRTDRASGLAYEPAWLAGQIATIYLPWLFAALLTRWRVSRFKWLEPALFALALGLLVMTYSRGGILVTLAAAGLTFLLVGRQTISRLWSWFMEGFRNRFVQSSKEQLQNWGIRLGALLLLVGLIVAALATLSKKNYFSNLWRTDATSLQDYIIHNYAGARLAYAWGALETFQQHPWTGVGLGASGFYLYQNLPDWSLTTIPEIARQLSPDNHLYPNPKNLYARLLAETGLIGFGLFLVFQLTVLGVILASLQISASRFLGIAGLFSWLAILLYALTQDSFAVPNLWINLGILVGMSGAYKLEARAHPALAAQGSKS